MSKLHYTEFWQAVKTRLNTATMQAVLGGANRVYLESEDYSKPEGVEGGEWGRVVIVPTATLWADADSSMGPTRNLAFMVRAELSNFTKLGYDHTIPLDAAQDEAENQLIGWCPGGLTRIVILLPLYLQANRQPLPLWDDDRGLYFTSAQFRTEVTKV